MIPDSFKFQEVPQSIQSFALMIRLPQVEFLMLLTFGTPRQADNPWGFNPLFNLMNLSIPYDYWYLAFRHQKVIPTQILQEIRKRLPVPGLDITVMVNKIEQTRFWWQMNTHNTHRITKIVLWKLSLKIKTACACFLRGPLFVWLVCREIVHSKSWRTSVHDISNHHFLASKEADGLASKAKTSSGSFFGEEEKDEATEGLVGLTHGG